MILNLNDLFVMALFFTLAFFQFISVYYLASLFSNKTETRIIYGVSSPFIFIVLGFPFKLLGLLKIFALLQYSFFFICTLLIIKNRKKIFNTGKIKITKIIPIFILLLFLIHFFSFEARNHYSYAFPDMTSSHEWVIRIINDPSWGYQPGLAIYLSPLYYFLDPVGSLDYLAFAIGLVFLIYTAIILENIKKNSSFYFLIIFTLSLFIENQKFLIGFSTNQFFILYIPLIIYLLNKLKENERESKLYLFLLSVILLSLTLTNPPLALSLGYFLIFSIVFLPLIFKFSFKKLLYIYAVYLLGIGLYITNGRMNVLQTVTFLNHYTFQETTTGPIASVIAPGTEVGIGRQVPDFLLDTYNLLWEVIKFKFLENPFDSFFVAGGYVAVLFSFVVCTYSIIKKDLLYFLLSSAAVLFGISTLTGIGQYSFIMGRVGWYFILIVIILASLIIPSFASRYRLEIPFIILGSFVLVFNSLNPPKEYRFDNENIHLKIYKLIKESNQSLYFYSTLQDNRIYQSNKDVILISNLNEYLETCKIKICTTTIIVIDKSTKLPDPVLSRAINKEVINDKQVLETFLKSRNQTLKSNIDLERKLIQEGFITYFEDENNSILIKY